MEGTDEKEPFLTPFETIGVLALMAFIGVARLCRWGIRSLHDAFESLTRF